MTYPIGQIPNCFLFFPGVGTVTEVSPEEVTSLSRPPQFFIVGVPRDGISRGHKEQYSQKSLHSYIFI